VCVCVCVCVVWVWCGCGWVGGWGGGGHVHNPHAMQQATKMCTIPTRCNRQLKRISGPEAVGAGQRAQPTDTGSAGQEARRRQQQAAPAAAPPCASWTPNAAMPIPIKPSCSS
jgi:hypothetical protein